jgi:hypothetical protein
MTPPGYGLSLEIREERMCGLLAILAEEDRARARAAVTHAR